MNFVTGAGTLTQATSTPTPPPGFQDEAKLYRTSGALAAPVCANQELPFQKAAAIAGKVVDFSVYMQALAGLSADNGNLAFIALITGTDSGGVGFGNLRGGSGVNMSTSNKAISSTVSTTTGLITAAVTAAAGQPVYFTAATMPTGLTSGQIYYVSSNLLNSGTAFTVAATYAQAIAGTNTIIPSTSGTTLVSNAPTFTPAWTGLTIYGIGAGNGGTQGTGYGAITSNAVTLSAANWTRVDSGPLQLPQGITEAAVLVCFNPNNASSGGTTDGLAFTGAQLEVLSSNRTTATGYEFKAPVIELAAAQRFYFQMNDTTTGSPVGPIGTLLTTTTGGFVYNLPVPMDATPIFNAVGTVTTTTFKVYVAADTSTLTSAGITAPTYAPDNRAVGFVATLTTASTAGWACELVGQTSGAAVLTWGVDF